MFIHWSPEETTVKGGLLQDEGVVVVGESDVINGRHLVCLRAHAGRCGGGVFFKLDGTLAEIHQGLEHESVQITGGGKSEEIDVTRKEFEKLKGQKDGYTYFLGSVEISEVLK